MSMIIRKHYSLTSPSILHVTKSNMLIYYEEKNSLKMLENIHWFKKITNTHI